MAEDPTRKTEYVVLRLISEATTAPAPSADGEHQGDRVPQPETWAVVDSIDATSAEGARRQAVRDDLENLKTATLVAVPSQSWKPQKPKVRQPDPVIEFEDV